MLLRRVQEQAPSYYDIIKTPMDMATINENINARRYKGLGEFIADFELMVVRSFFRFAMYM